MSAMTSSSLFYFCSLEVEIVAYFATKSIDEFLLLQQLANIEVIKAIKECGADLALPTTLLQVSDSNSSLSKKGKNI